jgi:drug/metabolite transporter (DMT)-like permease
VSTRRSFINVGWLVLMNLVWGGQFPVYKHAADYLSDSALSFYTFALAILMLLPFMLRERRAARRTGHADPQQSLPFDFKSFLMLGAAILPPSIGLSWGIEHSSGSNGAILYLSVPILMLVLAVPLLGERLTWTRVATLLLALIGTYFVSSDELLGGKFTTPTLLGNLAILAACLGSSFYNIYSKRVLERYTGIEVLVYSYTVAAVLCAVASLCLDARPFYDVARLPPSTWLAIAALGGIIWGVSMVLFLWLLKRVDVGQVSISLYLQAFFGVLLSALILGERLRATQIVGGVMVLVATILAESHERRLAKSVSAT